MLGTRLRVEGVSKNSACPKGTLSGSSGPIAKQRSCLRCTGAPVVARVCPALLVHPISHSVSHEIPFSSLHHDRLEMSFDRDPRWMFRHTLYLKT